MSQRILTVVEVAGQDLHLMDWHGGRGGPRLVLRADSWMVDLDNRDTAIGDVFGADADDLNDAATGERIVILEFLGTANRVRTARAAGGLVVANTALDLEALGLHTQDAVGLARADFWVLDSPNQDLGVGHFEHADSDLDAWKRDQAAKAAKARSSFRVTKLFNPYNFVPVPESAAPRSTPAGHLQRAAGSLSGRIFVTVTAATPLLIRTGDPADPPRRDGSPFIPASALKGSLRSLHETLTGSCYRVVDLDYTPGYRDLLQASNKAESAGWRLAVVDEVDGFGRPTSFQVCDQVVWTQFTVLQDAYRSASVYSGDRVRIQGQPRRNAKKGNRFEIRGGDPHCQVIRDAAGGWVVLAGDVRPKGQHSYFFAVGHLTDDRITPAGQGWDDAWAEYLAAVDQSRDVNGQGRPVPNRLGDLHARVTPQGDNPSTPFYRLKATDAFARGYVLWVRLESGTIAGMSLAHTWRHPGRGSVAQRLPQALHACQDAADLCPSCALFGSAPSQRAGQATDAPAAYQGHVRFLDAVSSDAHVTEHVELAPPGQPKPSAGNFYLEPPAVPATGHQPVTRAKSGAPPLREWGSALDDDNEPRRIRGRKFYWHTSPRSAYPRHINDGHQGPDNQGNVSARGNLIDTGATFPIQIVFEGLTRAQLGGLLVTLDPALGLPVEVGRVACWHVGGGRPLGLGTVVAKREDGQPACSVTVDPPGAGRYEQRQVAPMTADEMAAAVADFVDSVPPGARSTWSALSRLLTLDWVNPENVRYPSTSRWPVDNQGRPDWSGTNSLAWWKPVGGPGPDQPGFEEPSAATHLLLPRADDPDPKLPVDPLEGV